MMNFGGPGFFISRQAAADIVSPASGETLVWDTVNSRWLVWNGTNYVAATGFQLYKKSNTTVPNTDPELVFHIGANQAWRASYSLFYGGLLGSGGGLTITPGVPSGATYGIGYSPNASWTSNGPITIASTIGNYVPLEVVVLNGSTAGNVTLAYSVGFNSGTNSILTLSSMIAAPVF